MPKKMLSPKVRSQKHNSLQTQKIHDFLGESSDDSEPFLSAATETDVTNYFLDTNSQNGKNAGKTRTVESVGKTPKYTARKSTGYHKNNDNRSTLKSIPHQRVDRSNSEGSSRRKQKKPSKTAPLLRDIRQLQNSTKLLIPRQPFSRLVRDIFLACSDVQLKITPVALEALQESAELYLTHLFQDCYACTIHRDRKTLMVKDMWLVRFIRGRTDPGNS